MRDSEKDEQVFIRDDRKAVMWVYELYCHGFAHCMETHLEIITMNWLSWMNCRVGSMAYFFGDQNLPRTDVSTHNARELDTVTFKAANNDSTITVYGVAALTRYYSHTPWKLLVVLNTCGAKLKITQKHFSSDRTDHRYIFTGALRVLTKLWLWAGGRIMEWQIEMYPTLRRLLSTTSMGCKIYCN